MSAPDIPPERLAEMRRIKDAATPGPWEIVHDSADGYDELYCAWHKVGPLEMAGEHPTADGIFAATFDPPTIELLLTIAEREARTARERDELVEAVESFRNSLKDAADAQVPFGVAMAIVGLNAVIAKVKGGES